MQDYLEEGCIIVINITKLRSNAIIISPNSFKAFPLLNLDISIAKTWINQNLTIFS